MDSNQNGQSRQSESAWQTQGRGAKIQYAAGWRCVAVTTIVCDNMNHRQRTQCYKCNAPKPIKESDESGKDAAKKVNEGAPSDDSESDISMQLGTALSEVLAIREELVAEKKAREIVEGKLAIAETTLKVEQKSAATAMTTSQAALENLTEQRATLKNHVVQLENEIKKWKLKACLAGVTCAAGCLGKGLLQHERPGHA